MSFHEGNKFLDIHGNISYLRVNRGFAHLLIDIVKKWLPGMEPEPSSPIQGSGDVRRSKPLLCPDTGGAKDQHLR